MKNLKKNWFTYFFSVYSLVMVVDRLLYRFWDIGTNENNMLTMWICLLPLWIYFLQQNEKPPSEAPSDTPDPTPPGDE